MAAEVITREDLQDFRAQLLNELKEFVYQLKKDTASAIVQGYKTKDVKKILGCSTNKLQSLRISGKLHCSKIGGTIYYKAEEVCGLLENGC